MRTAVIIPSRDSYMLSVCMGALKLSTPGLDTGEVGLFVIPNGTPEQRENLDAIIREVRGALPPAAVVEDVPDSLGPWYGNLCHAGAAAAARSPATELVFLNDDTQPCTGWLDLLRLDLEAVKAFPVKGGLPPLRPGLVGCRGPNTSGPQNIFDPTEIAMRQKHFRASPAEVMSPFPVMFAFPRIVTFACLVETAAYFDAGGFDLDLPAHTYSDDILSIRLLKKGYHNYVSRSFVSHLGSRTLGAAATAEEAKKKISDDLAAGEKYVAEHYPEAEKVALDEMRSLGFMG